jgi:hypothetical protein
MYGYRLPHGSTKPWSVIDPPPLYSWRLTAILEYFDYLKKIWVLIFPRDPLSERDFNPAVHRFFPKEFIGHGDPAGTAGQGFCQRSPFSGRRILKIRVNS